MKILYVDLQYDYGMKHRGINTIGEFGFRKVFKSLHHDVNCFYYDDFLNRKEELQDALIAEVDRLKPDLVFFCLFEEQFKIQTLDLIRTKTKTMNWFGDDQWRFETFTKKFAPHFSYCVTTDYFALAKYKAAGIQNVILSQWAALNLEIDQSDVVKYDYDISFIGGSHSVRRWFVNEFKKAGLDVAAFGYGWPAGVVSLDRMVHIFKHSKINLNLGNSVHLDLRYLTHSYKNPLVALKSSKSSSQIKARNFEIPYYGGFQMTDYVPRIESYFELGKELVCYSNVDEAIMLAKHYLQNDEDREKLKHAGIRKSRGSHTYLDRFKDVFNQI